MGSIPTLGMAGESECGFRNRKSNSEFETDDGTGQRRPPRKAAFVLASGESTRLGSERLPLQRCGAWQLTPRSPHGRPAETTESENRLDLSQFTGSPFLSLENGAEA